MRVQGEKKKNACFSLDATLKMHKNRKIIFLSCREDVDPP